MCKHSEYYYRFKFYCTTDKKNKCKKCARICHNKEHFLINLYSEMEDIYKKVEYISKEISKKEAHIENNKNYINDEESSDIKMMLK